MARMDAARMITAGFHEMSMTELKAWLRTRPREQRSEISEFLRELEFESQEMRETPTVYAVNPRYLTQDASSAPAIADAGKVRSFEEAFDYTFANFDNALRKLAQ